MAGIPAVPPPRRGLASERGAFDLPSIITGVVVVGVLTAGVLASIFGVIPFAQDHGAKQDAAAIRTAESVAKTKDGRFMDTAGLVAAGYLPGSVLSADGPPPDDGSGFSRVASTGTYQYQVSTDAKGSCYVAVARSRTGTLFYGTEAIAEPKELTPSTSTGCLDSPSLSALTSSVGGFSAKYIPAPPAGVTGVMTTPTSATFSWAAVGTASGYQVEYRVNGGSWTMLASNQAGTTAVVTGAGGNILDLRVSSVNAAGSSAPTRVASVALPAATDFASTVSWTQRDGAGAGGWYDDVAMSADGAKIFTGTTTPSDCVLRSLDGGTSWAASTCAGAGIWYSVASSADGTKLIGGRNGTNYVQISTDSGATWTTRTAPGAGAWRAVASSADGTKLAAVRNNGNLWTSSDSGATWTSRGAAGSGATGGAWTSVEISDDGTKLVAGRVGGLLYTSTDSGATWKAHTELPAKGHWLGIGMSADGMRILASDADDSNYHSGSALYLSTDAGATWKKVTAPTLPTSAWWVSVASSDDGTKLAAGMRQGLLYTSVDGGVTWKQQTSLGSRWWASVAMSSDGSSLAAREASGKLFTGSFGRAS